MQDAFHCLPVHVQVWIYRDKATGQPKGDGTVTYEDPFTAGSAVSWFSGKEFKGEQCCGSGVLLQHCVAPPGAGLLSAVLNGLPCCDQIVGKLFLSCEQAAAGAQPADTTPVVLSCIVHTAASELKVTALCLQAP